MHSARRVLQSKAREPATPPPGIEQLAALVMSTKLGYLALAHLQIKITADACERPE
jgi:hypothetical protein